MQLELDTKQTEDLIEILTGILYDTDIVYQETASSILAQIKLEQIKQNSQGERKFIVLTGESFSVLAVSKNEALNKAQLFFNEQLCICGDAQNDLTCACVETLETLTVVL